MTSSNSLLPVNASVLERNLEQALTLDLPIDIANLWHPLACHKDFLPALALQYGDPYLNQDWDESIYRQVLGASFASFQIRGTRKALIDALAPFGTVLEINEWFNEPYATPGTFGIRFALSGRGMDENAYNEIMRLIDEVRPVSKHLTALDINLAIYGAVNTCVIATDTETLTLYPHPVTNINQSLAPFLYAGGDCAPCSIEVFPSH